MLVRAKLQFEGFDNATQPQKAHWESVRPVFASPWQSGVSIFDPNSRNIELVFVRRHF